MQTLVSFRSHDFAARAPSRNRTWNLFCLNHSFWESLFPSQVAVQSLHTYHLEFTVHTWAKTVYYIYMYTFWVTYTHTHREMVDTCRYVFTLPWMWYAQHVWRFCQMFDPLFDMFKVEGNNYNHFNCKITVGKSCFCEIGACQKRWRGFQPGGMFIMPHAYILFPARMA